MLINGLWVNFVSATGVKEEITGRLGGAGAAAGFAKPGGSLAQTVGAIISAFLGFLGVVALILIIYGGYLWMTAGGNEEKVKKAQTLLKNAIIGLIIITMAYAISNFVVSQIVTSAVG